MKKLGLLRPNSIDSDVLRASVKSSGASLEDFDENLPEEVKHRKGREHYKSWFENANPPVVTDVAGRKRLKIEGVLAYQNWHDTENPGVMQYKDYTGGKAILLDLPDGSKKESPEMPYHDVGRRFIFISVASLAGGLFLLGSNMTGNAIGNLAIEDFNWASLSLIALGIAGVLAHFKLK